MADPLVEQIADALKTQLETLTTGNGYTFSVESVVRPPKSLDLDGYQYEHNRIYLQQGGAVENEDLGAHGNPPIIAWDQDFVTDLVLRVGDASVIAMDRLRNLAAADLMKCIALGYASGTTLDGLTQKFRLRASEPFTGQGGSLEGIRVIHTATYRVNEDDPTVAR